MRCQHPRSCMENSIHPPKMISLITQPLLHQYKSHLSSSMKNSITPASQKMVIYLLILLSCLSLSTSVSLPPGPPLAKQGCQQKCGRAVMSYPFGIGSGCYHNEWFAITCNNSSIPAKPYLTKFNLEVLRISLASQTVKINMPMIINCTKEVAPWTSLDLSGSPFTFSRRFNVFIPVGCTGSSLSYSENRVLASCGQPVCSNNSSDLDQGVYDDVFPYVFKGVCQANRPPYGLTSYSVNITEANGTCRYVTLAESDPTSEEQSDLSASSLQNEASTPVVLSWLYDLLLDPSSTVFQEGHCDLSAYLDTGVYSCSCPDGHVGNPYFPNGCQEVEECASCDGDCKIVEVDSNDTPVSYYCQSNSRSWKKRYPWAIPVIIGVSVSIGTILSLLSCYWLHRLIKRWKENRRKDNNFKRNGGLLLQQQVSTEGAIEGTKVFTSCELDAATDRFNKNRILGQGGQGTVYKGMLVDGTIIAVKKAKKVDQNQLKQFINEMVILSQLNHRNIVKLLGCCLETDVPLLVYEYISNGTLFHHIQDPTEEFPITWKMRLQIATEVAGAIAYLHSASSIPIYHRDIKSSNILLDEKYKAKVSDFGASRTIPVDQTHLTTIIQGTFGYLDPEYFQSNQLTEKSDVYSFGVVLVELLTGQRPIRSATEEQGSLVGYFLSSMENSCLFSIVDNRVVKECREEDVLAFASLARWCLHLKGKQRPTMKEVMMELEGIKSRQDHSSTPQGLGGIVAAEVREVDYSHSGTVSMDWESSRTLADQPLLINTF